ncbi:MAG: hypothetical protein QOK35_1594 [Pseudonocardiales bacterium]|nr:hypothetical protein [Pseudonocardiales bacterium]
MRCHARRVPAPPAPVRPVRPDGPSAPDRYADAVRARRTELRGARALLLGGHRAELRSGLAAGRLAASAELATTLAAFDRELRRHADHADRAVRAALPGRAAVAVDRMAARAVERWAAVVLPAVRRVATARRLPVPWTVPGGADPVTAVLARPPVVPMPAPDPPPRAVRALVAGATEGTWRLALLPAAVLPAVGLPALGGRSVVPLAAGLGLALLVLAGRARRDAADRARLRRWGSDAVAAVRTALETELSRRLLEVERLVGAALDDAVTRQRAVVDDELRALASGQGGGG